MDQTDLSPTLLSLLEERYPGLFSALLNSGVEPTDPSTLRDQLVTHAAKLSPGVTTDLPGTLIEDMASTAVGALLQIDQAKVDLINAISPLNVTSSMLDQFGEIYGVKRGVGANPSAYVTFTGTPGLFLGAGFQVSDGTYLYETQENVTLPETGRLTNIYVLAISAGEYSIPAGTITQVVSGLSASVTLSVINPQPGTIGAQEESDASYRARIIQAGQSTTQGTPNFIKSCLQKVPNIIERSLSVSINRDVDGIPQGYAVTADGGDPQQIAGAIYESCFDLLSLQGSTNTVSSATQSNPCTISTTLTHGLTNGQNVTISGAQGMNAINGSFTATVLDAYRFTIPLDTSTAPLYSGGGLLETNPRNLTATLLDGTDRYDIPFIRPLQQKVRLIVHWQTSSVNIIDNDAATRLCAPNLADYINSLSVNEPINIMQLSTAFEAALLKIIPGNLITELSFELYLNDILTLPSPKGTTIAGDPQSYFTITPADISLVRR